MLGRQQALAKSVEIALLKDPTLPEVEHDSDQIHQVLLNLLLNALQAIDQKGKVVVTVAHHGASAVVEITDNGRGIAPENLPNIFRPFYTTKGDGTGLGLSLARRIVEDHQGRIDVISTVGKGTTFAVVLPLQRTPPLHPQRRDSLPLEGNFAPTCLEATRIRITDTTESFLSRY